MGIDLPPKPAKVATWTAWARAAVNEKNWETALSRWEQCIAKFGARTEWVAVKASVLLELGRKEDAVSLLDALVRDHPKEPPGFLGLARVAMRDEDWEKALSLWERCFEFFPDKATPWWLSMRAKVLSKLGRYAEAEKCFAQLSEQHPQKFEYKVARIRAALDDAEKNERLSERREEMHKFVMDELISRPDVESRLAGTQMLSRLGDVDETARQLLKVIDHVVAVKDIAFCFNSIPVHIERGASGPLWERLLEKTRRAQDKPAEKRAGLELELGLLLALERFAEFREKFDAGKNDIADGKNFFYLERVYGRLSKPEIDVFAERKVFCIGLSKTGTTSVNGALNILGIDAAHWTNPLTHQVISDIDFFLLGACTDMSVAPNFEKLYYTYPNAQFILTKREIESWAKSFRDMGIRNPGIRYMFPRLATVYGLYYHHSSIEEAYQAFERRVDYFFADKPPGKLLKFDIGMGHGWNELCAFLGEPLPQAPFPWLNKRPV